MVILSIAAESFSCPLSMCHNTLVLQYCTNNIQFKIINYLPHSYSKQHGSDYKFSLSLSQYVLSVCILTVTFLD